MLEYNILLFAECFFLQITLVDYLMSNPLSLSLSLYIYMYKLNEDSEYPKNECSIHGYLIQNITAEQLYIFFVKKQEI